MRRYTFYIIMLLAVTLFGGCGDAGFEYGYYPCRFNFNNSERYSAALASAINENSPGIFCRITTSGTNYSFSTNQGLSDVVAMTAVEQELNIVLGVYNETGIIVGYGNANYPFTFYAYDSQCPNCYKSTSLPRYSLTMNSDGTATCRSCSRVYNMNNGGIIIGGDNGEKMIRYRATVNGSYLSVNN